MMKTMQLLALAPGLMYGFRFINYFLNPGEEALDKDAGTANEDILADENLEDEELPNEKPPLHQGEFGYVADDAQTPPEREGSEFEPNIIDEK